MPPRRLSGGLNEIEKNPISSCLSHQDALQTLEIYNRKVIWLAQDTS